MNIKNKPLPKFEVPASYEKYAEGGYLRLWIPESDNARKLAELRALIHDTARLREAFGRIYEEVYRS